jgi:phosphoglucomutase
LTISSFKTLDSVTEIDFDAPLGTTYALTPSTTVTIIDQFEEYVDVLKTCFDFDALQDFAKRPGFSLVFDGMHGAGGPFARRVLVEELSMPEVRLHECERVYVYVATYFELREVRLIRAFLFAFAEFAFPMRPAT